MHGETTSGDARMIILTILPDLMETATLLATMELVTALLETLKDLTDLTLPGPINSFLAVSPLLTQNSQI